jgi:hypothetical protein
MPRRNGRKCRACSLSGSSPVPCRTRSSSVGAIQWTERSVTSTCQSARRILRRRRTAMCSTDPTPSVRSAAHLHRAHLRQLQRRDPRAKPRGRQNLRQRVKRRSSQAGRLDRVFELVAKCMGRALRDRARSSGVFVRHPNTPKASEKGGSPKQRVDFGEPNLGQV